MLPAPPPTEVRNSTPEPQIRVQLLDSEPGPGGVGLKLTWPVLKAPARELLYRVHFWSLTDEQVARARASRVTSPSSLPPVLDVQTVTVCNAALKKGGVSAAVVDQKRVAARPSARGSAKGGAPGSSDEPLIIAHVAPFEP